MHTYIGTHYTWEMLNRLKVDVHHEGLGQDGGIGWIFAVKYVLKYYIYVCMVNKSI